MDGRGTAASGSAQDCLDPRQQLAWAERLGDIIVGADLQADDAIHFLRNRRRKMIGEDAPSRKLPAKREPILASDHSSFPDALLKSSIIPISSYLVGDHPAVVVNAVHV